MNNKEWKAEQVKLFDKLTPRQGRNALRFGTLSDQHLGFLRDWMKDRRKQAYRGSPIWNICQDIIDCAIDSDCEPKSGTFELTSDTYSQWLEKRKKLFAFVGE